METRHYVRKVEGVRATRADYVRPITVGITFTAFGELLIFLLWGLLLFPEGNVLAKLAWTATCGIAMGAVNGAVINVFVTGRLTGPQAIIACALIYFAVLVYCTVLCYRVDLRMGLFGARPDPGLFLAGGFVPAFISSLPYAWLLYSERGRTLLDRVGY
jgi:hypothetical protein